MRSSVMSVTVCVGGWKQPPHAEARRSPAMVNAEAAAATPRASFDRFMMLFLSTRPSALRPRPAASHANRPADEEPEDACQGAEGHAGSGPAGRRGGAALARRRARLRAGGLGPVL